MTQTQMTQMTQMTMNFVKLKLKTKPMARAITWGIKGIDQGGRAQVNTYFVTFWSLDVPQILDEK